MFKRIIALTAVLIVSVTALFACNSYKAVKIEGVQDTDYRVESQGGSAVQYGDYIYFINGTSGYTDETGEDNVFGEVVKGAMYRAKLLGEKQPSDYGNVYALTEDKDGSKLTLVTTKGTDYRGDETYVVDVELIVPKRIGTDGYAGGGIFLFDDYVYYATPHDRQNKSGSYMYAYTDFFRTSLDGKKTQKLYTAESSNAAKPYMFYHYGNALYIAVLEDTDLVSVKVNLNSGKTDRPVTLAENVTNVVFPTKPVYYKGISTDTVYDFIYVERTADVNMSDPSSEGKVLEFLRPDNSVLDPDAEEKAYRVVFQTGKNTLQLVGVRDGLVYYLMTSNTTSTSLYATNLYTTMSDNVKSFRDADKRAPGLSTGNFTETVLTLSDLSSRALHPFIPGYDFFGGDMSNNVQVVTTLESALSLYSGGSLNKTVTAAEAATVYAVDNGVVYFGAGSSLYSADMRANGGDTPTLINDTFTAGTFGADIAARYVFYFGTADGSELATGYTHVKVIDGLENDEYDKVFLGAIIADEQPSPFESLEIVEMPLKTEYHLNEKKFDYDGLVVKANYYTNSDGVTPDAIEEIPLDDDMFTGFSTATAGPVTITVTYERRSVTFTITILEEAAADSGCGSLTAAAGIPAVATGLFAAGLCLLTKKRRALSVSETR